MPGRKEKLEDWLDLLGNVVGKHPVQYLILITEKTFPKAHCIEILCNPADLPLKMGCSRTS